MLQRFNPEAIRQVAEQTTDELTKSRLLGTVMAVFACCVTCCLGLCILTAVFLFEPSPAIIGDQMRQSGESGGSPQHLKQQKALEELNSAATEVGSGYSRVRYVWVFGLVAQETKSRIVLCFVLTFCCCFLLLFCVSSVLFFFLVLADA